MKKELPRTGLPREFLWDDFENFDELFNEPAGEEIYQLYKELRKGWYSYNFQIAKALDIINEAYYQAVKIVYYKGKNTDQRYLIQEVKASVGSSFDAALTISLVVCMLKLYGRMTDETRELVEQLSEISIKITQSTSIPVVGKTFWNIYIRKLKSDSKALDIDLRPHPIPVAYMDYNSYDWEELTNGFSREAIYDLLYLWQKRGEREALQVLKWIYRAFKEARGSYTLNVDGDKADEEFFAMFNRFDNIAEEDDGDDADSDETDSDPDELVLNFNKILAQRDKRISELESEVEQLKSELNQQKPKKKQETAFTLSMIVEYCKKKPIYQEVRPIVSMLYKFTKKCSDEDSALVDSIEEEFNTRHYGTVNMNNPHFDGAMYEVKGNKEVKIGGSDNG